MKSNWHKAAVCLALLISPLVVQAEAAPEKIARGLLMRYGEKMIFSPCRERTYVEVKDATPGEMATSALIQFGLADKKPLYVELSGRAEQGMLTVNGLNFAALDARCQASASLVDQWRAVGSGPDWSLRIGEKQLRLEMADSPLWLSEAFTLTPSADRLDVAVSAPDVEQWRFERGICQQEPGILFGWRAQLAHGGKILQGCAWQGY